VTAVIGLSGLKGCGKDTAASVLIEDGWTRLAFADPLRQMLYTLNPIVTDEEGQGTLRWQTYLDAVGYDEAKKNPEVRRLMQVFGTEVIRQQYGQDAWVNLAANKINREPGNYVVTDVRFDNEARMIHSLGGFMVRIERDGLVADGHASEAGISDDLIDAVIKNNDTIESLHLQMRGAAKVLGSIRRS
jgi:hypothetical protein